MKDIVFVASIVVGGIILSVFIARYMLPAATKTPVPDAFRKAFSDE